MKKNIHYIVWLLAAAVVLTACESREPELFDKDSNGAYFDYENAVDFEKTLNFSDYIVGSPDTVSVTLKVKLLGYLMDEARTLSVKTKTIEGYEPAGVTIGEVVFANKEYEKQIEVKVKRPEVEDVTYAVCIYLDGSGDIGTGIDGRNEINLFVTESYTKPDMWYSHMDTYLGEWSKEKHIFLAQHTGSDKFYSALYDSNTEMHDFDAILALNVSAVNALLTTDIGEDVVVDLPILKESDRPAYGKPYFWSEYEPVLGMFRANKFCRFVNMLGGATTKDIVELFASDAAKQKMDEEAVNFHKDDVIYMLNEYYSYALMGYPIAEYKNLCWVELNNALTYKVRIPYWWEDPNALGTGEIVKKYFGEYSDDKYRFMLMTVMKDDGAENFITESILPFVYDKERNSYVWDSSLFGTKQLAGEERLKECYRLIKTANDKLNKIGRGYDIPEVVLD